ncbi:MAG: M48 family metalloprotease [Micavibrio sp.]|nr:M48 family metalloprotease [Micavibrio sp.]
MTLYAMMMDMQLNFKRNKIFYSALRNIMLCFMVVAMFAVPARAQFGAPTIIRDTEIEDILKGWAEPLLKQAGIPKNTVQIILVQSPQINAFVAGGANMFFYTGLIEKTEGPEEILGVMAHEIGHIAGGHIIKNRMAMERASYESILGMVVGIGAALASGKGEAAGAIIGGSQDMAFRRFLSHSRVQESSADQAAYSYLSGAGITPKGLSSFFGKLQSQELLPATQQSEFMRSHPVTRDRIESIDALMSRNEALKNKPLPDEWIKQHALLKAKLLGFINPGRVEWNYDASDRSIPAQYARTIAAYRQNNVSEAIKLVDSLLAAEPNNPYFLELKGQMLAEFSRVREAIPPYRQAVKIRPDAALIRIALAHVLIESSDHSVLPEAITHLERAQKTERHSSRIHRLLATAYGRMGNDTQARLHLAEEATLGRKFDYAKAQAEKARDMARSGSPEWLKANDLLKHIENLERRES